MVGGGEIDGARVGGLFQRGVPIVALVPCGAVWVRLVVG